MPNPQTLNPAAQICSLCPGLTPDPLSTLPAILDSTLWPGSISFTRMSGSPHYIFIVEGSRGPGNDFEDDQAGYGPACKQRTTGSTVDTLRRGCLWQLLPCSHPCQPRPCSVCSICMKHRHRCVHFDSHEEAHHFRAHTCTPLLQQLVQVARDLPPAAGKLQGSLPCALQRRGRSPGFLRGIVEEPQPAGCRIVRVPQVLKR